MQLRLGLLCLVFTLLGAVAAADPPSPAPSWVPSPIVPGFCPEAVVQLHNLDGTAAAATTYALALAVDGDKPGGTESGSLAFYVGDNYYEVPFHDVVVTGWMQSANEATPIVVRFPTMVHIDAAYVVSVNSLRCDVGNLSHGVTNAPLRNTTRMDRLLQLRPPFDLDSFEQTARTLTPTAALFVYSEGPAPCDTPDASPTPINLVTLIFPKAERKARLSASYFVAVNLDATGTVTWATIAAATARNPDFEREAIRAVEGSTFTPEIFRCNPVYGTYVMVVTFGRP